LKTSDKIEGIGISCGGPLNSKTGTILSPPNLPGWDNIPIVKYLEEKTGLKAWLCNDANACALAEWKLGAGKGCSNMIFMTFGTGLGAGIILNGRLYTGTNDMAGELGHIRLSNFGPVGYGKMGSFEGFCSGGGITQLAKMMIMEELQLGNKPFLCRTFSDLETVTAEKVGLAAKDGDILAMEILKHVGIQLILFHLYQLRQPAFHITPYRAFELDILRHCDKSYFQSPSESKIKTSHKPWNNPYGQIKYMHWIGIIIFSSLFCLFQFKIQILRFCNIISYPIIKGGFYPPCKNLLFKID
jgi:hypothetical protein